MPEVATLTAPLANLVTVTELADTPSEAAAAVRIESIAAAEDTFSANEISTLKPEAAGGSEEEMVSETKTVSRAISWKSAEL